MGSIIPYIYIHTLNNQIFFTAHVVVLSSKTLGRQLPILIPISRCLITVHPPRNSSYHDGGGEKKHGPFLGQYGTVYMQVYW